MQIVKLSPDSDKCSLLRLAISSVRNNSGFSYMLNSVTYSFSRSAKEPEKLRFDLTISKGKHTQTHSNIGRSEVMAIYFKKEKAQALKSLPNSPEGTLFWQING
jgi:hypothetical protein